MKIEELFCMLKQYEDYTINIDGVELFSIGVDILNKRICFHIFDFEDEEQKDE